MEDKINDTCHNKSILCICVSECDDSIRYSAPSEGAGQYVGGVAINVTAVRVRVPQRERPKHFFSLLVQFTDATTHAKGRIIRHIVVPLNKSIVTKCHVLSKGADYEFENEVTHSVVENIDGGYGKRIVRVIIGGVNSKAYSINYEMIIDIAFRIYIHIRYITYIKYLFKLQICLGNIKS